MCGKEFYELVQAQWNEDHREDRISKVKAEALCRTMLHVLDEKLDNLEVGERVSFYGFGSFTRIEKPGHTVGTFRKGETMVIPSSTHISFTRTDGKK